jgi:flagellar assembly factor FliW
VGDDVALTIDSTRFGRVEIDPETVIDFPDGLIGLGGRRWALVADEPGRPIVWLHCIDDPSLSLPVTEPHRYFSRFGVELTDDDADRLGLDEATPVDVYVTIVAASELSQFTANLKAPILIRDGVGYQVINQAPGCELRAPLFAEALAGGSPAS